ncbi:MAG: DUF2336 domain-containing protein [Parvibaculum sp.]|uniref:DUF2336 domain-containing protein n=1 Tax=Parvibaculum sp. TaxID=2024848 RepID=UPI0025E918FF|nr:DUF2336 domain-containing protein [Parvibaculum sp.]MCE9649766.1 DUF2336 domain-containing protein [Parvibaculum sp.]
MLQDRAQTDHAEAHSAQERREIAAAAVAQLLARGLINDADRDAAHTIIEALARDAEMRVRKMLAEAISHYDRLPRETAEQLARDVEAVAMPVLQHSPVLDDEFLIALIGKRMTSEMKQIAIAQRLHVSAPLAEALVGTENANVVEALLENAGAKIDGNSLVKAAEDHASRPSILELVASRPEAARELAQACRSLLLDDDIDRSITTRMRDILTQEHNVPPMLAEELTQATLERSIVERIATARDNTELGSFARSLHHQDRLNATVLFRALCAGRLDFFEIGLSVLAHIPRKAVAETINPAKLEAFRDLYGNANLAPFMRRAVTVAALTLAEQSARGTPFDAEAFVADIIGKIVAFYRTISPGPLDLVIAQLSRMQAAAR